MPILKHESQNETKNAIPRTPIKGMPILICDSKNEARNTVPKTKDIEKAGIAAERQTETVPNETPTKNGAPSIHANSSHKTHQDEET